MSGSAFPTLPAVCPFVAARSPLLLDWEPYLCRAIDIYCHTFSNHYLIALSFLIPLCPTFQAGGPSRSSTRTLLLTNATMSLRSLAKVLTVSSGRHPRYPDQVVPLTDPSLAPQQTCKRRKVLPSRKSQMFSVRRFSPRGRSERSSFCSTSGATAMYVVD